MNKNELIEKKLKVDELAISEIKITSDKIYDYVNAIDTEIFELENRLNKLKTIYEVYKGFDDLNILTRKQLGDEVCKYALERAKNKKDGYFILDLLYNASMDGSDKAIIEYARVLAYGLYGVKQSVEEAYDWLERYANKGNAEACYAITLLHFDFPSVIEAKVAYEYCQKAASLGYSPAIRRLSQPFDLRTYTEKLIEKAEHGDRTVYFELSKRHDLSYEEKCKYLMLALENEDKYAEYNYALELISTCNKHEAELYLEKSGQHGNEKAYMKLAELCIPEGGEPFYNYSKIDVTLIPLNYHQNEFEYYKKASELGEVKAMVYVGIAYKQGYVINRNYETAFNHFKKAFELKDEYLASYYLAECYELGLGVESNEHEAVKYYTISAEKGNINSMLALSRIYKDGLGKIEKNKELSTKYFFMSGIGRD